jgi:hypothetical protein
MWLVSLSLYWLWQLLFSLTHWKFLRFIRFPSKLTLHVTDSDPLNRLLEQSIARNDSSKSSPVFKFSKNVDESGKSTLSGPWILLLSESLLYHVCLVRRCISQLTIYVSNSILFYFPAVVKVQRVPEATSQRLPVSEEQKNYALQRAKQYKSKYPITLQIMQETHVYNTYFMVMLLPCIFFHLYWV